MASPSRSTFPSRQGAVFTADPSDFEQTARQQLGDLGTGTDGFDALFAIPAGAIDGDTAALATFDEQIAAADFNAGDFANAYHAAVDADLPGFLADGDTLNGVVQNPQSVSGAPTITPAPPVPVDTSSGGGGGGGDIGLLPENKIDDPVVVAWWDSFSL